jgi:hypothetical protein
MRPVDFEGSNIVMGKPEGMTDEQCIDVPAHIGVDNDGFPFVLTVWQPNKEDIEAVNAGRPLMLKLIGSSMQPACIYTYDEEFNCNSPR